MKAINVLLISTLLLFASFVKQTQWTKDQLIQPVDLAKTLNDPKAIHPVILNIGPMEQIKTAIKVGAANTDEGIKKLQAALSSVPKEREVVVYCGCCSSDNCPNIKPAFDFIKQSGYKKVKVLEIPVGLGEDWRAKGYPME